MISGMNAKTGQKIEAIDHLRQSIKDILTTPLGGRVMRRDYGSQVFELIDQASNEAGKLRLQAASADALMRWEPRFALNKIALETGFDGAASLTLQGDYKGVNTSLKTEIGGAR